MTSPELQGKPRLPPPPPPAPTRRDANPWKMSETARKPGPSPDSRAPDLLEILLKDAGPEAYAARDQETGRNDEAPARPPEIARRSGFGLWPLIVLGIAVMVLLRVLFEARATGNWAGLVAPLLAILFVAHGWWRLRQRRRESKDSSSGSAGK